MTPEDKQKLKIHSKHHSAKHMAIMNAMMRSENHLIKHTEQH